MDKSVTQQEVGEITCTEYSWKTSDNLKMHAQCWKSNTSTKAILILAHGFGDHINRYDPWAVKFAEKGYDIISMDMRGHGKSDGKRGYAPSYQQIINDYDLLVQKAKELYPDVPRILYGHSFGGNVVVNYCTSNQKGISGIIISSPWLSLEFKPSRIKYITGNILRHILPGMTLNTGLRPQDISRDKNEVQKYANDPLVHEKISLKLYFEIEAAGEKASKSIYKINVPILVMHGSGDRITSFSSTKEFVMNASHRTTFKEWPEYYHELHNDIGADMVFQYVLNWLNNTTKD